MEKSVHSSCALRLFWTGKYWKGFQLYIVYIYIIYIYRIDMCYVFMARDLKVMRLDVVPISG